MTECAVVPDPEKKSRIVASRLLATNSRSESSTTYNDFGNGKDRVGSNAPTTFFPWSGALCRLSTQTVVGRVVLPAGAITSFVPSSRIPDTTYSPDSTLLIAGPVRYEIAYGCREFARVALAKPARTAFIRLGPVRPHSISTPSSRTGKTATTPGGGRIVSRATS